MNDVTKNAGLNTLGNNLVKQTTSDSEQKAEQKIEPLGTIQAQDALKVTSGGLQQPPSTGSLRDKIGMGLPIMRNISFDPGLNVGQFTNACPTAVLQNQPN